jgi:GTP cyclohydrolase I
MSMLDQVERLEPRTVNSPADRDRLEAEAGIRALLRLVGEDPDREGLQDTPGRVVKAYLELCRRPGDPAVDLARVFPDTGPVAGPVSVHGIDFTSVCEHHLLPFTGRAWLAYLPGDGRVVGLSKLPRTLHHYAARPQVQERMTRQIADALEQHLDPRGVAVLIQGDHSCMALRGACAPATMETRELRGAFGNGDLRREFMEAVRGGRGG